MYSRYLCFTLHIYPTSEHWRAGLASDYYTSIPNRLHAYDRREHADQLRRDADDC